MKSVAWLALLAGCGQAFTEAPDDAGHYAFVDGRAVGLEDDAGADAAAPEADAGDRLEAGGGRDAEGREAGHVPGDAQVDDAAALDAAEPDAGGAVCSGPTECPSCGPVLLPCCSASGHCGCRLGAAACP